MPTASEEAIVQIVNEGNGASVVIPKAGGGFMKYSYLWRKLRVDTCDSDGKILLPARRVGGSDIPSTTGD